MNPARQIATAWNAYDVAWRKFGESIPRMKWDAERLTACAPPPALDRNEIARFYDGLGADYYARVYLETDEARDLKRLRDHIRTTRHALEAFTQYAKTSHDFTKEERDALNRAPALFEQFVATVSEITKERL